MSRHESAPRAYLTGAGAGGLLHADERGLTDPRAFDGNTRMEEAPLKDEVLRFIVEHFDSVPQLESLILIRAGAPRTWSVAELAARIYVDDAEAARLLAALERRGLVVRDAHDAERFAYDPGGADADLVAEVAGAYRRHLVRIASAIHAHASPAVREFARAFDIKKDR